MPHCTPASPQARKPASPASSRLPAPCWLCCYPHRFAPVAATQPASVKKLPRRHSSGRKQRREARGERRESEERKAEERKAEDERRTTRGAQAPPTQRPAKSPTPTSSLRDIISPPVPPARASHDQQAQVPAESWFLPFWPRSSTALLGSWSQG